MTVAIARDASLMSRPVVWYVPGSEAAARLQELPDDLERWPLSELTLPAGPELLGILLVDLPENEASARALAVASVTDCPWWRWWMTVGRTPSRISRATPILNPSVPWGHTGHRASPGVACTRM